MLKKNWIVGGCLGIVLGSVLSAASLGATDQPDEQTTASPRQRTLLDADWRFHLGDITPDDSVIKAGYDDAQWQHVNVPHDYVLDGTYNEKNDRGHGYLKYDVGWYRKHFTIPESDKGKILRLDFDGVFRDSQVWFNGQLLGTHPSGYTPFSYDVTKLAKVGGENTIVVRVDPRKFEGWWYEGGGIYRRVWLTALDPVHIAQYGTYVTSTVANGDQGADDEATINIQTTVQNEGADSAKCNVAVEIIGPDGNSVAKMNSNSSVGASGHQDVDQKIKISHPQLWSLESPNLYYLHTTISEDGKPVDETTTTFGIRTIRFDPNKGFFLNGKHVEIQGVACHQDFAGVGIAVPDSLEIWRAQQLKNCGANGWRTAHDMANESVIDACDRVGMLVMDENRHLGDTQDVKTKKGTGTADLSDLATLIQRDRNHPSVIMWSMCNEEPLQGTPEGFSIVSAMKNVVHKYDRTRPVTSAMNGGGEKIFFNHGIADAEDMIGMNYNYESFDKVHEKHPDKPLFCSEGQNEKTQRGEYVEDKATGRSSAYNFSEKTWLDVETRPFFCGSYVWTGIDYKGEPNPYGWPDVSNNTGLLDSCGFRKDKSYYFESCWSDKPMVHLMPMDWNPTLNNAKTVRVVAFSNAKKVELFLNGKSLGSQDMPHDSHVEWQVPYAPGELLANASTDGKIVATEKLETTDAPARIQLKAARDELKSDSEDAEVVQVSILDDKGRVVPDSKNRVTFKLTGGAKILGVGNGDPADHDPDKAQQRNAFHGRCMAVIEAGTNPGTIELTASSPGLAPDSVKIKVK